MTAIVNAANRRWLVGMEAWWNYPGKPRIGELREDADDLRGAEWYTVRSLGSLSQVGFSVPPEGVVKPKGVYSMAAAIADAKEQPWLGIFQLSDTLWWYIAVRDGQTVLPEGDIAGDENTVFEARARHESYADWTYISGTLDDLVPLLEDGVKKRRLCELRSLAPVNPARIIVPGVLATAALAGGYWAWQHHEHALKAQHEAQLRAERARLAAKKRSISPLLKTPAPATWLHACWTKFHDVPLSKDGWAAVSVSCSRSAFQVVWDRRSGATVALRPRGSVFDHGNKIRESWSLGSLPKGADHAKGLHRSDMALYALLQPLGVTAQLSAGPHRKRLPGAKAKKKKDEFPSQSVQFLLPVSPFAGVAFNAVPGLRLTGIERTTKGWRVSGVLYGK